MPSEKARSAGSLRAIRSLDHERGTPAAIGALICASIRATKERCERLSNERYLFVQLGRHKHMRFPLGYYPAEYGLTDKGRNVLAAEQNKGEA